MTADVVLEWFTRAVVGAMVSGGIMLLKWQRTIGRDIAVIRRDVDQLERRDSGAGAAAELRGQLAQVERALQEHKLYAAEHFVCRDDWVPTISRVLGMLERHGELLARLDERTRPTEERTCT